MSSTMQPQPCESCQVSTTGRTGVQAPAIPLGGQLALEAEGWVRRFTAAPARAQEAREMYESLGHEVRLELVPAEELRDECSGCAVALSLYRIIYTRRRS